MPRPLLFAIVSLQMFSAVFFTLEILGSLFALPFTPFSWRFHELIEIAAAVSLILGLVLGTLALRQARARTEKAEEALKQAQTAFREMLNVRFSGWDLTPAERDVALFAIKGFSTADIAELRGVSEGTIKAQTASIYRKAGVKGRPQLLSVFIDELVESETENQSSAA